MPPRTLHRPRWRSLAAAGLAATLTLAACSGGDADEKNASSATTTKPGKGAKGDLNGDGPKPTGTLAADSGFKAETNGFSFQNYGNEKGYPNLDAQAMQTLFGDQVCASTEGGTCKLTAPADEWMKAQNDGMNGGHCQGMATVAWLLYDKSVDPNKFGGNDAASLKIEDNAELARLIASTFVAQGTSPGAESSTTGTVTETIDKLKAGWADKKGFVLGFYKMGPDGKKSGGHAVTPIGVEDRGDGKMGIVIYDNNFPVSARSIIVDPAANTWAYSTAANPKDDPEAYVGDANNPLELAPIDMLTKPQACPFCNGSAPTPAKGVLGSAPTAVPPENKYVQVYLNQAAGYNGVSVQIVGADGQPLPGVIEDHTLSDFAEKPIPPTLKVPKDAAFTIKVDGSKLTEEQTTDLQLIGPGYDASVDEIKLSPGQTDTIDFNPAGPSIVYTTSKNESPNIGFGLDGTDDVSYAFDFKGVEMGESGGKLSAALDQNAKTVRAASQGSGKASVGFTIDRIAPTDEATFNSDGIELDPGHALIVNYGAWKGSGSPIPVGVDTNGDGQPDEQLEVAPK